MCNIPHHAAACSVFTHAPKRSILLLDRPFVVPPFFEALLQKEGDGKWSRCGDSREEGRIGACWSKSGQPNIAHCVNLYFLERALHGSSSSLGLHLLLQSKNIYNVVQCGELSKATHFGNQGPIYMYDDRKKSFFRKPERKQ